MSVAGEVSLLSADDLYLFNEGSHYRLYDKLGSHLMKVGKVEGCYFAVWAPNAQSVSVVGEWDGWHQTAHPRDAKGQAGSGEGVAPQLRHRERSAPKLAAGG